MADFHKEKKDKSPPKRFSIISSRANAVPTLEISGSDLSDLKALYDRQFRRSSDLTKAMPVLSAQRTSITKHKHNVGFDISFTIPERFSDTRFSKAHFAQLSSGDLPDYIKRKSVSKCLKEKNDFYDGRRSGTVDQDRTSDFDVKDFTSPVCTFEGEITLIEKSHWDTMEKQPMELTYECSIHVIQSSIDQNLKFDEIWTWPWIDFRQNIQQLYVNDRNSFKPCGSAAKLLPKLVCPKPRHTFKRYLESVEPLVTPHQFQTTREIVKRFILNEYGHLSEHFIISDSDKNVDNWIHKTLQNYDYCLSQEGSHLMNMGIIAPFCHDIWPVEPDSMLQRAIVIIRLATEFWDLIRTENLKPIQDENKNNIDMQQFLDLFSSTTLPGDQQIYKCRWMRTENEGETARHIIVVYRGTMFVMNVADENYQPLHLADIADSLKALKNFVVSDQMSQRDGLNILTASAHVKDWYEERNRLSHLGNNREYFDEIDQALFVLSLDHMNVTGLDHLGNEAMFADGCNRWYDKGLNFYIHNNGYVTLNINSKLLDGSTVAFLLHYIHLRILDENEAWVDEMATVSSLSLTRLMNKQECSFQDLSLNEKPHRESLMITDLKMLDFSLDLTSHEKIATCATLFNSISSGILTAICKIDDFNQFYFSSTAINKDAFAHLVLQLNFFRMYYRPASMGTKVGIKKFANTRYDIMRSTTKESVQWCKAHLDQNVEQETKNKLFWIAHKKHMELLKECINGEGYDNHLNALRNLSDENGVTPENNMFEDKSYFLSGGGDRFEILAETLGVGCTSCPVFLPCNPKGYGVGYSVANGFIFFTVSSWKEEMPACAPLFAATLKQTCREMIDSPPAKLKCDPSAHSSMIPCKPDDGK